MYVDKKDKTKLLIHLLGDPKLKKVLVFVQMKHIANKITEELLKNGITAAAIHGNKSQPARQKAIQDFTQDRVRVLVATDIASRGIDIDGITHVINYELSNIMESYVHRIGRTARAGSEGTAISLVTGEEKSFLIGIEKETSQRIHIDIRQPFHSREAENASVTSVGKAKALMESQQRSNRPPREGGPSRTNKFHSRRKY
jgi:ATP-dependent RNA helicase RhlE